MKDIIERAIKNGYRFEGIRIDDTNHKRSNEVVYWPSWTSLKAPCFDDAYQYSLNDLLADEGFVKALFGEEKICTCIAAVGIYDKQCLHDRPNISIEEIREICTWEKETCGEYYSSGSPAYEYHCRELSTIFDQDKKIEYIRRVMR